LLADEVVLLAACDPCSLPVRLLGLLHARLLIAIGIVIIVDVNIDIIEDLNKFA
jgi:hypothetical protein